VAFKIWKPIVKTNIQMYNWNVFYFVINAFVISKVCEHLLSEMVLLFYSVIISRDHDRM